MLTPLFLKELKRKQDDFIKVKEEIYKNNQISGVLSAAAQLEAERVKVQSLPANGISSETTSKRKPEVRVKPEYLSARSTARDR